MQVKLFLRRKEKSAPVFELFRVPKSHNSKLLGLIRWEFSEATFITLEEKSDFMQSHEYSYVRGRTENG